MNQMELEDEANKVEFMKMLTDVTREAHICEDVEKCDVFIVVVEKNKNNEGGVIGLHSSLSQDLNPSLVLFNIAEHLVEQEVNA